MFVSGIRLEVCGVELPWGATAAELAVLGNPTRKQAAPRFDLTWTDERVCGLRCRVMVTLYGQQKLTQVRLGAYDPALDPSWEGFQDRVAAEISRALGAPDQVKHHDLYKLPSYAWNAPGAAVRLTVHERFGIYYVLRITRRRVS